MFPSAGVFNAASASIVVGFMILPMIVSLSEDVLRSVPRSLREAAYALGATKLDVTVKVVVPAAISGIVAAFLLALSRAIGETMAVALAAGNRPKLTLNPLESIQTMTAYIVEVSQGDTPAGTLEYRTIFAVGLALFVTTMALNVLAQWFVVADAGEVRMSHDRIQPRYRRRRASLSQAFAVLCLAATAFCVLVLVLLLVEIFWQGLPWLNWRLSHELSRRGFRRRRASAGAGEQLVADRV